MAEKNLILHVGHGKTGTSYLQSCLSIYQKKLLDFNIYYPTRNNSKKAAAGLITSGNGSKLFLKYLPEMEVSSDRILYSSERLFHTLPDSDKFKNFLDDGECNVEVILYTRNLFECQFSCWQQLVKRHEYSGDVGDYLMKNPRCYHPQVLRWAKLSEKYNFKLRLRNYSNHKHDVFRHFSVDLLGIEDFPFESPKTSQVNRSLTCAEINFQRVFNLLGIKSPGISDELVNRLPNIKASKIKCSPKVYDFVRGENIELFASINKYLDPDEVLEIEPPEQVTYGKGQSEDHFLNSNQIDIIANYLTSNFSKNRMNSADVDAIRDIALRISKNSADSKDALDLMRIALRQRPNGKFIKKTVLNWEKLR